jgi:general secretion pathway protein G
MNTRVRRRADLGFTLIEIMVVVVILGILAALVAPNVMRRIDDAQITKVKQDMRAFETALSLYKMDNYKYPSTDQGLGALVTQPNDPTVRNWKPGRLSRQRWPHQRSLAERVQVRLSRAARRVRHLTLGADGQEGGEGVNADRGNWQTE